MRKSMGQYVFGRGELVRSNRREVSRKALVQGKNVWDNRNVQGMWRFHREDHIRGSKHNGSIEELEILELKQVEKDLWKLKRADLNLLEKNQLDLEMLMLE